MNTVNDLVKKRATAFDAWKAMAEKDKLTPEEETECTTQQRALEDLDKQITRAKQVQVLSAASAQPVADQDAHHIEDVTEDPYLDDAVAKRRGLGTNKGLRAIAAFKIFAGSGGNMSVCRERAVASFGERHPITRAFEPQVRGSRALVVSVGASGGFIVPPDYMNEIIELLRPKAVVRGAAPRVIPMPRGTMTLPAQTAAATANYGTESAAIANSQQTVGQIVASYKKLTALVPVSNDLMRYADPAADAFVRDDLVKVIALREDLAFLLGDGTVATPRGFTSFANGFALQTAGNVAGVWSATADSTAAVGGNFITSTETFTLASAATELGGLVNKLDTANVEDTKRVWFMHPRTFNYLFNVQNSLGVYVYRDELTKGTLLSYPYRKSTQIPINIWDTTGTNKDCSFLFLAEMDEVMILDSMSLELAVSREGMYVDANNTTWSAFQNDQTLIRAIAEHDFQMRHDAAVAISQFVRWAPALT